MAPWTLSPHRRESFPGGTRCPLAPPARATTGTILVKAQPPRVSLALSGLACPQTPCPAVPAGSSGWRPPTCLSQFNPWLADGPDRLTSRPALWVTPGVRAPLGVLALPAPHGQTELLRGGHTPVT